MILLDVLDGAEETASTSKTRSDDDSRFTTRRRPDSVVNVETESVRRLDLPDYATSQALAGQIPAKQQDTPPPIWRRRRFWRAVLVAFVIYGILSVCIAVPLVIKLNGSSAKRPYNNWRKTIAPHTLPIDIVTLPSTFGDVVSCDDWKQPDSDSDSPYMTVQYSIPVNETLTLRSNASDIDDVRISGSPRGSLTVDVSDDAQQTEAIVTVGVKDGPGSSVQACFMRTSDGWGVDIYVPEDARRQYNYTFDFNVVLPRPRTLPSLTSISTSLPAFNQSFGNLDSYGVLNTFVVVGTLGYIMVESVNAEQVLVQNSAGNITGSFNASENIILGTVLAPVSADVSLYNRGCTSCPPTVLDVETGSSDISLNVTLYDGAPNATYPIPTFYNDIKTFGGFLTASFYHHYTTRPSCLFVKARNNLDPAEVFVDAKFEGTFDVHTTLSDAVVDSDTVNDPQNLGRTRQYEEDLNTWNRVYGWTGWGDRPSDDDDNMQGHIAVASSLSPAVLQLTQFPDPSRYADKLQKPSLTND